MIQAVDFHHNMRMKIIFQSKSLFSKKSTIFQEIEIKAFMLKKIMLKKI